MGKLRIKKLLKTAVLAVVCAVLLINGTGMAQGGLPLDAAAGAGVDPAVADVEIYPDGDAARPLENDAISMVCQTMGANIYYTTDGAEPDEGSAPYDPENPPRIRDIAEAHDPAGFLLKARAFYGGEASANVTEVQFAQVACEAVEFSIGEGIYPAGTGLGLSCPTPGAQIYYKTDGAPDFTPYEDPVVLLADTSIEAYAAQNGYQRSESVFGQYRIGAADVYEPNDTMEQATPLAVPAEIEATVSNSRDLDYFSFSAPGNSRVRIVLEQPDEAGVFYDLKLFDAQGKKIDVSSGEGKREILRYLAPGDYYALVCSNEHAYSSAVYRLAMDALPMDAYDFSEYNLVNATFHPDSRFHFDSRNILNAAAVYTAAATLSRWDGYLSERQDPYILYYDDDDISDRNESFYHTGKAAYRLKDIVMLPPRADALDNAHYKNAIYTYGALYCGIQEMPEYYNENKAYFYHPEAVAEGGGHAVTVIGWDDSIPKEKFRITYEGQEYEPACDGAFLAKNSYGEQTGDGGYFYISYCSGYFSNNAASAVLAEPVRSDVNVLYMHDPYGYTGFIDKEEPVRGKEIWTKNVFTASSDQLLKSVSFYALGMEQEYDVYVENGAGKTLAASGINRYAGYYTVDLSNAVPLKKGEDFSITVRQANAEGKEVTAALERRAAGYSSSAVASPGQSFVSFDGEAWTDISKESNANNCIKAYAHDKNAKGDAVVTGETGDGGASFSSNAALLQAQEPIQAFAAQASSADTGTLPAAFDLRSIGAVTSVKNQGNPPTCWTFATMGSTESCLLKAESGFDTGVRISADEPRREIILGEDAYAAAAVQGNGGNDTVYWQFAGDLDSIAIKNRTSRSGEPALLFSAEKEGRVTATAVSAADGTKSATVVFELKAAQPSPSETPPAQEPDTKPIAPRTGDAGDAWAYYLAAAAGFLLLAAAVRKLAGLRK